MKKIIIVLLITIFAGPVFAGPWIDLQSNTTYTAAQLEKRYDALIRSKYPLRKERAMNRRAIGTLKGKYVPTVADAADEAAYEAHTKAVRDDYEQAVIDNVLLVSTIQYEQAQQRLTCYRLSEGVAAVAEIPEEKDPDTGEILQEYVPAIIGIDPLPATIEQNTYDDEGNLTGTETILNPCIVQDEAERSAAQEIINDATTEVLTLADEREE